MMEIRQIRQDRGTEWSEQAEKNTPTASFIAVSYGKVCYTFEDHELIMEKGCFLYIPPHTSYHANSLPSVFHEKYVVTFQVEADSQLLPLLDSRTWISSRMGMFEWMIDRVRTMHEEWREQAPYAAFRCQAILSELAVLWGRELLLEPAGTASNLLVDRMKAYISSHYREKVTKEELGFAIGRTPNHAAALFKRVTGQTISEYIHAVRVKTAIYMLKESLLTVGEISDYLGYRDVTYFQRIFKRIAASAPSDYMKDRNRMET